MSARDLSVLSGVVLIVAMLIIPFPPWLLSVLIIVNISLALIVLLTTMNMQEPLQFSIFPSLLLLLTLFRLGLNVSTTRSILSNGDAGKVVETFGSFVVGGNVLVGLVVFIILIIIQFIVITKGAERVSEVAARFTLDAMPGKQMSIDADLNAGMVTEQEAKVRREKVAREADFYGAMDGASKFVKGDAIAGIIIVLINVLFGIVIGMLQKQMSIQEAASSVLEKQKKIAFITTDTYRIAAVEQLRTYAELLNAPLEVCYTKEEFKAAQQKFADFDHVFIDTAGRNFKDGQYVRELKEIIPFERKIQAFLVMSATSKYEDMKELIKQFSSIPIDQLIFTKVDETDSLGSVMNLLAESRIGLGYMTNGQNVPEDIRYLSNASFVRLLTGC